MATGRMFMEKRQHPRREKALEVTYKLMPKDIKESHAHKGGKTADMSVGGARIIGEIVGNEKDHVRIEFKSPKSNHPITVIAEIKWIKKNNGAGQFGLQFTKLSVDEAAAIEEILED